MVFTFFKNDINKKQLIIKTNSIMKTFASILFMTLAILSTSCSDDDNSEESNLLSIGVCGDFFNGLSLQTLCGVEAFNSLATGPNSRCTYFIKQNSVAAPEDYLYQVSLVQLDSNAESMPVYEGFKEEYFPGEMLTPLTGIGDEAVFGVDGNGIDNEDSTLLFRVQNVVVALFTEEIIQDFGCNNAQQELTTLANLITENLQ